MNSMLPSSESPISRPLSITAERRQGDEAEPSCFLRSDSAFAHLPVMDSPAHPAGDETGALGASLGYAAAMCDTGSVGMEGLSLNDQVPAPLDIGKEGTSAAAAATLDIARCCPCGTGAKCSSTNCSCFKIGIACTSCLPASNKKNCFNDKPTLLDTCRPHRLTSVAAAAVKSAPTTPSKPAAARSTKGGKARAVPRSVANAFDEAMESKHAEDPIELGAADTIGTLATELNTVSNTQASTAEVSSQQLACMGKLLTGYKRLKQEQADYITKNSQASAAVAAEHSKSEGFQKKLKAAEKELRAAQSELAKRNAKPADQPIAFVDLSANQKAGTQNVRATTPATQRAVHIVSGKTVAAAALSPARKHAATRHSDDPKAPPPADCAASLLITTPRKMWIPNPAARSIESSLVSLGLLHTTGHVKRAHRLHPPSGPWRVTMTNAAMVTTLLRKWSALSAAEQQQTMIRDVREDSITQVSDEQRHSADEHHFRQRNQCRHEQHGSEAEDPQHNTLRHRERRPPQRRHEYRHQLYPATAPPPQRPDVYAQPVAYPCPQIQNMSYPPMAYGAYPTPCHWMQAAAPAMMTQAPPAAPVPILPTYSLAFSPYTPMQVPFNPYQQQQQQTPTHSYGMRF